LGLHFNESRYVLPKPRTVAKLSLQATELKPRTKSTTNDNQRNTHTK
jgi:hypothetical protein